LQGMVAYFRVAQHGERRQAGKMAPAHRERPGQATVEARGAENGAVDIGVLHAAMTDERMEEQFERF